MAPIEKGMKELNDGRADIVSRDRSCDRNRGWRLMSGEIGGADVTAAAFPSREARALVRS